MPRQAKALRFNNNVPVFVSMWQVNIVKVYNLGGVMPSGICPPPFFFLHCCTLGRNALQGEQKGLVKHPARRETHKLPISHFEWRIFGTPQGCSLSPLLFCYLGLLFVTNQASYTSLSANKPKVNSEVCLKAISCRGLVKNNIKLLLLVLVLNFLVLKKKH